MSRKTLIQEVQRIIARQYQRMNEELLGVRFPAAGLTVVSKYWRFAEADIEKAIAEQEDE